MTTPAKPAAVIEWQQWQNKPPPRCCHTCLQYQPSGLCLTFEAMPPPEFASVLGACDVWVMDVPF